MSTRKTRKQVRGDEYERQELQQKLFESTDKLSMQIARKYKQQRQLGRGTFGLVYEVKDDQGKLYADKTYVEGIPDFNEIDILCKMEHPNILHAVDLFKTSDEFHVILPKADSDLFKFVKQNSVKSGVISIGEAVLIMYQIISAVHFFHKQGYFHCDIKPENVLMFGSKPVLSDFGWSYQLGYDTWDICGTKSYAAPQCTSKDLGDTEPYVGCKQIQSDIFALGAVFFDILMGEPLIPYDSEPQILRSNYSIVEHKLGNYINAISEPYASMKPAFECIYAMCRASNDDRLKTINEVLKQPVFASRGLTKAIGGKVKVTRIPPNICKNNSAYYSFVNTAFTIIKDEHKLAHVNPNLLQYCLIPQLILRAVIHFSGLNTDGRYRVNVLLASIYIAGSLAGKDAVFNPKFVTDKDAVTQMIYDIVMYLKGCLSAPTIYTITDNGLEVIWYLTLCLNNCEMVLKDPAELHAMYGLLEEKYPKLKRLRIPKNQEDLIDINFDDARKEIIVNANTENSYRTRINLSYDPSKPFLVRSFKMA